MEVVDANGNVSSNVDDVLLKWKSDYADLLNQTGNQVTTDRNIPVDHSPAVLTESDFLLTEEISFEEVFNVVCKSKRGKASGVDNIPADVLCNQNCIIFLHRLFNWCFKTGKVPEMWNNIIINPIPKNNMSDKRDPLNYRGIALAPASYKLYCNILNLRLSQWVEDNKSLVDDQNGFRKGRSTINQISSLASLVDVRKKLRKSTFCAFIDFKKAYDTINRTLPTSFERPSHVFKCGDMNIATSSEYAYLGLVLNEFLDFSITAKAVARSANRALGLVIA
ncbi:unnamed protein product [Mytilus edulis]|uniref:Reverse transcriptase domain-containing protein n=1 Tax=Mytilus edulis TaxID=6550 RepID=A0A8S3Q2W2_MYTED|nr:unnamed protein product [Mytilus edulis]